MQQKNTSDLAVAVGSGLFDASAPPYLRGMNGAGRSWWSTIATLALAWVTIGFTINAAMVVALSQWGAYGKARYHNSAYPTSYGVLYSDGFGVSWATPIPTVARFVDTAPTAPKWVDFGSNASTAFGAQTQVAIGWPARCATGTRQGIPQSAQQDRGLVSIPFVGALPGASGGPTPYLPLWRGVAINTLVLGSPALLLLLVAPMCASRRRRKGKCPRCAYDLKHDFARGCSECGWNKPAAEDARAA
jgi:hypothetical protein